MITVGNQASFLDGSEFLSPIEIHVIPWSLEYPTCIVSSQFQGPDINC